MALDQTAYKWRNDDGSETTATWVTAQNYPMTKGTAQTQRLRFSIDTDGTDPATAQYVLMCSMGTGGPWATLGTTPPTASATYTANSNNWVAPAWTTSVHAMCWGGGGAGGRTTTNAARGAGGGGGWAQGTACPVTPFATYVATVGTGGVSAASAGTAGGLSSFVHNSGTIVAYGGSCNQNNTAISSGGSGVGDNVYVGGAGGSSYAAGTSAGGGGAAGSTSDGGAGARPTAGTAGGGGGAAGGAGLTAQAAGNPGGTPGGGGGGALRTSSGTRLGGAGGPGKVILSWTPGPPFVLGTSANIAAGGTSLTSEQLNPNGKNYGTGRITDDTNPLPTFDFGTANQRTELEFTILSTGAALAGTEYFFRIETV